MASHKKGLYKGKGGFGKRLHRQKKVKASKTSKRRLQSPKRLEEEILVTPVVPVFIPVEKKERKAAYRDMLEQIMFKLPHVIDPLIGTPKQVQKKSHKSNFFLPVSIY